jgi:LPS sulfotransferase NodH
MNNLSSFKQCVKKIPGVVHVQSSINKMSNIYFRKKKVAMFHTGRCGSTVLCRMLNAHSKVFWADEIFEKVMRPDANGFADDFMNKTINLSSNRRVSHIYGFETKYLPQQHLSDKCLNITIGNYITSLRTLGFSYFIVLHRKNYLRRAISVQVGRERGKWHSKERSMSPTKIHIDINSFQTGVRREPLLELFACMDESYDLLRHSLSSNSLFITYEDDIQNDPLSAYGKVCEFLDLENEKPKIDLHKTNPFSYEQMISNFEEVEAVLKGTKYSWMLDD